MFSPDEFPVALLYDRALEGDLGLADPMRRHIGLDLVANRLEIRGGVGKADENVACHALTMDGLQVEAALVEIVAHMAGECELAVEIIGPLMIGADETHGGAMLLGADARAAMATAIVESADDIVAAADDNHRISADLNGEIGARLRQLAIMTDKQPVAIVDHLHIKPEIILVGVERLLEAEALTAVLELTQNVAANIHLCVLVHQAASLEKKAGGSAPASFSSGELFTASFNHRACLPLGYNATSASKLTTGCRKALLAYPGRSHRPTLQAIIVNCAMA
ncbi:hypothetical protein ACVITL_000898 [Rhizobium pisi]